jgi:NAD-dependent dihydropyrimidine dehydrogenase PreA subunit
VPYVIAQADCINCGKCRRECPTDTIRFFGQAEGKHRIDPNACIDCDLCARVCPMDCITREPTPLIDVELLTSARDHARSFFASRRSFAESIRAYALDVIANVSAGAEYSDG